MSGPLPGDPATAHGRPRVPKGRRPVYLDSPDSERLLSMVLVLASEVSTLTEELEVLRAALLERGAVSPERLHALGLDPAGTARRAPRRQGLIERMLRIVQEDLQPAAAAAATVDAAGGCE